MSAAPAAAVETTHSDPHLDRPATSADSPTSTSRLLTLVRTLIDYGKRLANALEQRTPTTNLFTVNLHFGTINIAQILACITRGLHRAAELEARLLTRVDRQPAAPATRSTPSRPRPLTPSPEDQSADPADPSLARLPTPAHIAAQLRHRPIGAVLADICRDLGIVPANPLWRELSLAILANGGNLVTLFKDTHERITDFLYDPSTTVPPYPPTPPTPLAPATGPP